jgi:hypothetical protein
VAGSPHGVAPVGHFLNGLLVLASYKYVDNAKQQMQWTKRAAHLVLPMRVKMLNSELVTVFRRWYSDFPVEEDEALAAYPSDPLLQISLVYIHTLMVQQIFTDDTWFERMPPEGFRTLTPITYAHINPDGTFELDMQQCLHLDAA